MRRRVVEGSPPGRESGQTLAVVAALVVLLMLVPATVQVMASNQLPMSRQTYLSQQALEAARAGLSDYMNWLQSHTSYATSYCSSGVSAWSCPSGTTADPSNPAFANTARANTWVYTQGSSSSPTSVAYQYLVDNAALSGGTGNITVYATGRAGAPGHWVYQTVQATVQYGAPPCPGHPIQVLIPSWAQWLSITAVGAQGGGQNNPNQAGGGGLGSTITATFPLDGQVSSQGPWPTPRYVTLMPGSPGYSGSYHLLALAASGGQGGCGAPALAGGNGGGELLGVSVQLGGGGGAGTTVCYGTVAQCANPTKLCNPSLQSGCMLLVAGGGGGTGGENFLGSPGGSGGWYCSANCSTSPTWSGNGGSGSLLLGLGQASGGALGGSNATTGAPGGILSGWNLLGALSGTGGGGGGGYLKGGGGGQAGLLGIGVGTSGGGGGAGDSGVSPSPVSCGASTSGPAPASAYDANGDGTVSLQLYTGSSCSTLSLLGTWAAVAQVQQIDPTPSLQ